MATAHVEGTLARPADEVFDLLADVRNEERWHPEFRGATKLTDGPIGAGTVFDARYRGLGSMRVEVTDYDRPRKLGFRAVCRPLEMIVVFRFDPVDGATHLAADVDAAPRGALRLAAPLLGPLLRRELGKRPTQMLRAFEAATPR